MPLTLKQLVERFRLNQYGEKQLIRDLQLLNSDLMYNFKAIADYGFLGPDDLDDLTSRVEALEAGVPYAPVVHTHDDRYYTESEVDSLLAGKSDTSHNHDTRYYTEAEVDSLLAAKLTIASFNNRPRFAAYGAGPGAVGVETRWAPNNVTINVGGHYVAGTGVFTCPTDGEYRIQAKYLSGSTGGAGSEHTWLYRLRAGVPSIVGYSVSNASGAYQMGHQFCQLSCLAGDAFYINVPGGYAMYNAANTVYNWFWGERVDL